MVTVIIGFGVNVEAREITKENKYQNEITNPKYDENGGLIEFTVSLEDADYNQVILDQLHEEVDTRNINLKNSQMNLNGIVPLSATYGVYKFVSGACVVLEFLTGYSCITVARFIGLQLINGYWLWNNKKYSATWRVTYGYIPGCEPRYSQYCFKATYTKIA